MAATIESRTDGSFVYHNPQGFIFDNGEHIASLELVFETAGKLSAQKDNVILIHHAISSHAHICSSEKNPEPGWWENVVGPNKAIDTHRFYVICINNLASCFGSSGPTSLNPKTQKPYQQDFPKTTINDIARSQYLLLQHLGIEKCHAVIGNSMAAMITLTHVVNHPLQAKKFISVSSCHKTYPLAIAFHQLQKDILDLDPQFNQGYYQQPPYVGFAIARKLGALTYRNPEELNERFLQADNGNILDYLNYNADKFIHSFDANSYLYLLDAMDSFDITAGYQSPTEPLKPISAQSLVISVESDVLYPPQQQIALYELLKQAGNAVTLVKIHSNYGHDAFYADEAIAHAIQDFL